MQSHNHKIPQRVALCDVDDTLISNIFDPDFDLVSQVKLNQEIINAMKQDNVKYVYLFTDMNFKVRNIKERQAVARALKNAGFEVLGVITPSDVACHLDENELNDFATLARSSPTWSKITENNHFVSNKKSSEENEIFMAALKNEKWTNKEYLLDKKIAEPSPGKAFLNASQAICSTEKNVNEIDKDLRDRSTKAKLVADVRSYLHSTSHPKSEMYRCFLDYNEKQKYNSDGIYFNECYIFDDLSHVLQATEEVNREHPHGIKMVPILATNHGKNLAPNTKIKMTLDYLQEMRIGLLNNYQNDKIILQAIEGVILRRVNQHLSDNEDKSTSTGYQSIKKQFGNDFLTVEPIMLFKLIEASFIYLINNTAYSENYKQYFNVIKSNVPTQSLSLYDSETLKEKRFRNITLEFVKKSLEECLDDAIYQYENFVGDKESRRQEINDLVLTSKFLSYHRDSTSRLLNIKEPFSLSNAKDKLRKMNESYSESTRRTMP